MGTIGLVIRIAEFPREIWGLLSRIDRFQILGNNPILDGNAYCFSAICRI
jgi:hypothetical protein